MQPLGGAERQPGRQLDALEAAELLDLVLLQPAVAADRQLAVDVPGHGELQRGDQVVHVAELPALHGALDGQQARRLEMPGDERIDVVADQRGGPDDGNRHAGVSARRAERELLDLQHVAGHAAVGVRRERGVLGQRDRIVRARAVDHRARHEHDPADPFGGRGGQHGLGGAHVACPPVPRVVVGGGVHVRVHHHVHTGEPGGQHGVSHVGEPPGHPGRVAPVVVDRHDAANSRRVSEPRHQRLPYSARGTRDRHHRRCRGGATLTANAALRANLPSAVSQSRLLPNSVAIMTLLSCPTI